MHPRRKPVPVDTKTKQQVVSLLGPRSVPDLGWLTRVTGTDLRTLLPLVRETVDLIPMERSIRRILDKTHRTYYAQFPAPLELYIITRMLRPRHVIESGVSSGLSSAHILAALERNGSGVLHSIDFPQYQKAKSRVRGELSWFIPPGRDSGWAIPSTLRESWDLRQGKSEDLLPALVDEVQSLDLFCHDSPWTPAHLAFEFETVRPKLHSGSIVVADNTDVNPGSVKQLARSFGTRAFHRGTSSLVGIRIP